MKKTPDLVKDFYDQDIDFKALLAAKKIIPKSKELQFRPLHRAF